MIQLHRLHNEDSMVKQFERQREGFLLELKNLLAALRIIGDLKISG